MNGEKLLLYKVPGQASRQWVEGSKGNPWECRRY